VREHKLLDDGWRVKYLLHLEVVSVMRRKLLPVQLTNCLLQWSLVAGLVVASEVPMIVCAVIKC
jgi:hypothetical protein